MKSFFAALPFALISFNDLAPLNSNTVTVSGLSSGAMMSSQMLISSSSTVRGAGLIAGGPFGCAEGLLGQAFQCIDHPETIDVDRLADLTKGLAKQKKIDPLLNLKDRTVFILNGTKDQVVYPESGPRTVAYLKNFMPEQNIKTEFSLPAGHSIPTVNRGNVCDTEEAPWVNNCGYDAVQNTLEFLLHRSLVTGGQQNLSHLYQIDLSRLIELDSQINTTGLIYVPANCRKPVSETQITGAQKTSADRTCDLHVVFHGCRQTLDEAGLDFIQMAGYNDWAEKNSIVVFYPNIVKSLMNPKGCWDWWGYTDSNYLTKQGSQIRSINKMIKTLTK